jgi:hypothetical protein
MGLQKSSHIDNFVFDVLANQMDYSPSRMTFRLEGGRIVQVGFCEFSRAPALFHSHSEMSCQF